VAKVEKKRINMKRITMTWLLFAWTTAQADTLIVNPGESIQAALDASANGDIVELTAGSWEENLSMPDHALTLRGAVDENGAPASSLDGTVDRAITIIENMSSLSIENLVITGQHATIGGGAYIFRSNPSFTNCRFENCAVSGATYYDGGGAVYLWGSSPTHVATFDGCTFNGNSANKGGAIGLRAASSIYEYSAVLVDCIFQNNTAVEHGGAIGAIYAPDQGVSLERCHFINNTATSLQGHALSQVSSITTSLHSCNIVLDGANVEDLVTGSWEDLGHNCLSVNAADADGDLRPDDCDQCDGPEFDLDGNGWSDCAQIEHGDGTFTFNVADGTQIQPALDFVLAGYTVSLAPGSYVTPAGGLNIPDVPFTLSGDDDGNDVPASSIQGNGNRVLNIVENMSNVQFEFLKMTGQHSVNGGGAYIYRSNPTFTNCIFESCLAQGTGAFDGGGAAYLYGTSPTHVSTFDTCAFISNSGNRGGAIALAASSSIYEYSAVVVNCLFLENSANDGGAICGIYTYDHGIDIEQCVFFNNTAAIDGSAIAYTSSVSTSIGNSIFCGLEPIIFGSWEDLGDNCFSESCVDVDGDSIPDDCDAVVVDPCVADLNGDGEINIDDLLLIFGGWGGAETDITGDGTTNVMDLLVLLDQWDEECP